MVPAGWDALLRREMADRHVLLAAFKLKIDRSSMTNRVEPVGLWILEYYFNARSHFLSLPSAMQGLCITAANYDTRRFSDNIIMDDAEFVLKCREECLASAAAVVSGVGTEDYCHDMFDHGVNNRAQQIRDDSSGNTSIDSAQGAPAITNNGDFSLPLSAVNPLEIRLLELPLQCSSARWEAMSVFVWFFLDTLALILFANLRLSPERVYTICYDVLPTILKKRWHWGSSSSMSSSSSSSSISNHYNRNNNSTSSAQARSRQQ